MILKTWRAARWKRSVLDAWSVHHARSGRSLDVFAAALVRYACIQGRDVLVHAAFDELLDWPSLSTRLAAARTAEGSQTVPVGLESKRRALRTLARTAYRQQILAADLADAAAIYQSLAAADERDLEPVDYGYLVDALTVLGRRSAALRCLTRQRPALQDLDAYTYLLANLLNPFAGGSATEQEWLHQLNMPLTSHALEPVTLTAGDEEPFCRLDCSAERVVTDGPLVSVLMPVHDSNAATDTAIRSVLAQSWRNLELIIVDDASSAAGRDQLRKWEGRDSRLRILYSEENRGAYCARNVAYDVAVGDFITVADKDDWHHPRKLELQARDLIEHPDKLANMSSWSRVSENLRFLVRYAPLQMAHPSQPSLFFRRQPVQEALGYWDSVRKGADAEYKLRMEKVFGIRIKPINKLPLALSLIGAENLSSRDFGLGYEHPERSTYKQTYGHWHRRIPESASPVVPKELVRRIFPAPANFLPEQSSRLRFDVVVALDLSSDAVAGSLMQTEIAAGAERGLRVAVLHLPDLMQLPRKPRAPADWLNDHILGEKIGRISQTDRAETTVLLIANPRTLQCRPEVACSIVAAEVFVLADQEPLGSGGYAPQMVAANIRTMFNANARWIPSDARIRRALRRALGRRAVSGQDWPGLQHLQQSAWGASSAAKAVRPWRLRELLE